MQIELRGEAIFICNQAVDFRKSINGLSVIVQEQFHGNPLKGLYIFYNKQRDNSNYWAGITMALCCCINA